MVERDRLSLLVNGPGDVYATAFYIIRGGIVIFCEVGQVVGIAVTEAHEHVVPLAPCALHFLAEVNHVVWQTGAPEGETVRQPLWIIFLSVPGVDTVDGTAVALIVRPGNVTHRVTMIRYLVAIDDLPDAVHVATAADLIPGIVRQTVAVCVLRHHDDTRLVHATEHLVRLFLIGIAPDGEVALSRDIHNRMVEVEGDVPSPSAEGHEVCVNGT